MLSIIVNYAAAVALVAGVMFLPVVNLIAAYMGIDE